MKKLPFPWLGEKRKAREQRVKEVIEKAEEVCASSTTAVAKVASCLLKHDALKKVR